MKATVVDLRYRMKEVLKALGRNEEVSILYHGKIKGTISPAKKPNSLKVREHPFFKMAASDVPIEEVMTGLRGGRILDL